MINFYYERIKKPNSDESDVDNFWNNLLSDYFPKKERYGIEQESRPLKELGLTKRTDFTIRAVRNGAPKKVIVIEDKRADLATRSAEWREALDQAIEYVELIRDEAEQNEDDPLHIIISIGTYLRFYIHRKGATDAENFAGHPDNPLELRADEQKVHETLTELHRITQH